MLIAAVLAAAIAGPAAQTSGPYLLALNKGDLTLAIVDPATGQVLARVPSGPDPHEVVASPDGRFAYITNYTQGNGADNTITVVDLVARKALPPIDLGALARPHGLDMAGGKLYFTAERSKAIGRIDPATNQIDWVLGTGQNGTHMVLASADGNRVFTTNIASASVAIIEPAPQGARGQGRGGRGPAATEWTVTIVPVGRGAEGFDVSPDGKELWTANAQDATVSVIDLTAKSLAATVPVPFKSANRLKFTPDGKLVLIADLGGHEVIVIDAATRKERSRIEVKGGAAGTQMDPDGSRAFVSIGAQNAVAVIDLKSLTVSKWFETGTRPDGLAWAPAR
jgi:YVTN family beta-propeller protein